MLRQNGPRELHGLVELSPGQNVPFSQMPRHPPVVAQHPRPVVAGHMAEIENDVGCLASRSRTRQDFGREECTVHAEMMFPGSL